MIVVPRNFTKQKGVYKVIERNRYIFIKADLHPVMHSIVLLHEIGHDVLHRAEAIRVGGFQEFNIFDMRDHRMEYEANMFAAQIALPDEDILELIYNGYDVGQIARAMESDINLVALKVAELNSRGYSFREQEHRNDFLK
ncbi:MAG: ImmA/IrrE family metallo-endopeptidase [Eubacteriales bacterium]|nr:ImmA/IrrE family metallo-endopeptidase [Eubacteriales bacterium]